MDPLQLHIGDLLVATGAARAVLVLADAGGKGAIIAEAVSQGMPQLRDANPPVDLSALLRRADAIPVHMDDQTAAIITLDAAASAKPWTDHGSQALATAKERIAAALRARGQQSLAATAADVRTAAVQAMLDRLRMTLGVQRCTYRQDVMKSYAFPVTYESRQSDVRRLLGDFTIVQTGQPVIEKLLKGKAQVVQEDCRTASAEPLFHVMLQHYGNMRAQIVTPLIRDERLEGVLSVHELRGPRQWTRDEMKLASDTTRLIGQLFTVDLD